MQPIVQIRTFALRSGQAIPIIVRAGHVAPSAAWRCARSPASTSEVVKRALELQATALVLVHNHPSGDPSPSQDDIAMTHEVRDAARVMGSCFTITSSSALGVGALSGNKGCSDTPRMIRCGATPRCLGRRSGHC